MQKFFLPLFAAAFLFLTSACAPSAGPIPVETPAPAPALTEQTSLSLDGLLPGMPEDAKCNGISCPYSAEGEAACAASDICPDEPACAVTEGIVTDKTCPAALGEACVLASAETALLCMPEGCDEGEVTAEYHKLTPAQAKESMDSGEDFILLDVRTQEEYESGHIPGAQLLPNESIGGEAPALLPDKDATILLYCRSGRRSKEAAEKLVSMGYIDVYDFGGITDWPYETVKS